MQLHLKIFDGFLVNIHVIDSLPLFYHDLKIITNSLRNLFFVPFTHYINLYQWVNLRKIVIIASIVTQSDSQLFGF